MAGVWVAHGPSRPDGQRPSCPRTGFVSAMHSGPAPSGGAGTGRYNSSTIPGIGPTWSSPRGGTVPDSESGAGSVEELRTRDTAEMMELRFLGNVPLVGDRDIPCEYPIEDAFLDDSRIVVLFDPDQRPSNTFGQFPNLVAIGTNGRPLGTAELPRTISGDCYHRIVSHEPLIAYSVCSYEREIDPTTDSETVLP